MKDNDKRLHPTEIPGPKRNGREMVHGEANENPLDIATARWPKNTPEEMAQIFQFVDEHMNSGDDMLRGSLADALRKRDEEWVMWLGKILALIDVYTLKQRDVRFMRMALKTMMYVLGFTVDAGVSSISEIAVKVKFGKTNKSQSGKQTVHKCAENFLSKLKLAPMLTQRTKAARLEMEKARRKQIDQSKNL